jgi:hypothetical protein
MTGVHSPSSRKHSFLLNENMVTTPSSRKFKNMTTIGGIKPLSHISSQQTDETTSSIEADSFFDTDESESHSTSLEKELEDLGFDNSASQSMLKEFRDKIDEDLG